MKLKIITTKSADISEKKTRFFHVNIAKKIAKKAVVRNKIKRRMRDIVKSCFNPQNKKKKYVFHSFSVEDVCKTFQELKNSVITLIKNYK